MCTGCRGKDVRECGKLCVRGAGERMCGNAGSFVYGVQGKGCAGDGDLALCAIALSFSVFSHFSARCCV